MTSDHRAPFGKLFLVCAFGGRGVNGFIHSAQRGVPGRPFCPEAHNDQLIVGGVNARSVGNKPAILSRTFIEHRFDVFVIIETWHERSGSTTLQRVIPPGYRCIDAARPIPQNMPTDTVEFQNHGGLAFIHRDNVRFQKRSFDVTLTTLWVFARLRHDHVHTVRAAGNLSTRQPGVVRYLFWIPVCCARATCNIQLSGCNLRRFKRARRSDWWSLSRVYTSATCCLLRATCCSKQHVADVQALHHGAQLPARSSAAVLGRPLHTRDWRRFSAASKIRQSTTPGPSATPVANVRLSLLLARRPGTHCLTIWKIQVSPETASAGFWKHICSLCTEASNALEVLRKCAIQIYYLLTYSLRPQAGWQFCYVV